MRKDMGKVITERARSGGRIKTPKGEKRIYNKDKSNEAEPKKESILRKWTQSFGQKESSVRFGPFNRFLISKIGCKWDDVYSEICKTLTEEAIPNFHEYVSHFVVLKCVERGGQIYDARHPSYPLEAYSKWRSIYVLDGIICQLKLQKRKSWSQPKARFKAGICPLMTPDGIWWEAELAEVGNLEHGRSIYDQFLGDVNDRYVLERFYGSLLRCVKKRQMNKREIKRIT